MALSTQPVGQGETPNPGSDNDRVHFLSPCVTPRDPRLKVEVRGHQNRAVPTSGPVTASDFGSCRLLVVTSPEPVTTGISVRQSSSSSSGSSPEMGKNATPASRVEKSNADS